MKKVAVFNDTSPDRHYGCDAVMSSSKRNLACKDMEVSFFWPVSMDWTPYIDELDSFDFDAIIVNGEGTIHHCERRRKARALLDISNYCKVRKKKIFLINSTLYELTARDFELLKNFDGIFVRESMSQDLLRSYGITSYFCPDLSMSASAPPLQTQRAGTLYTDSVLRKASQDLKKKALAQDRPYLPLKEAPGAVERITERGLKRLRRIAGLTSHSGLKVHHEPTTDYLKLFVAVQNSEFVVTGRLHAVTICLATNTPFIALESNTPKESLKNLAL